MHAGTARYKDTHAARGSALATALDRMIDNPEARQVYKATTAAYEQCYSLADRIWFASWGKRSHSQGVDPTLVSEQATGETP